MPIKGDTIIGISIGTTHLGLCFFKESILEDWTLRTFLKKWSKLKLRIILLAVERYIMGHSATNIALKMQHSSRSSIALRQIQKGIIKIACKHRAKVNIYTACDIKRFYGKSITKAVLSKKLATRYPELHFIAQKKMSCRREHHIKVFEAVAAAELLLP